MRIKHGKRKRGIVLGVFLLIFFGIKSHAQNSPYSARGLGEPFHAHNAVNIGMGGVSEAYSDAQSINFNNPASYSDLQLTTYDIALMVGSMNLKNQDTSAFHSGMGTISYLQIGVPLKKGGGWGLVFGLRPETKINYQISRIDSLPNIGEPASFLYQGSGGAYKAFVGTGYRIKGIRFGVNAGYLFGSKKNSTQIIYPAGDLVNSNEVERLGYGAFFGDAGVQAKIKLAKNVHLGIGASGGLKTTLDGNKDHLLESATFSGDPADPSPHNQDTVFYKEGINGKIIYPAHYGFGLMFQNNSGKSSWNVGADYSTVKWSEYENYGVNGGLKDSKSYNFGVQLIPSGGAQSSKIDTRFWGMVAYRLGFYSINKNFESLGNGVTERAFTFGLGLPLRNYVMSNQYTQMNVSFEVGKMGGKSNELSANFFRFTLGFSLSDIWFIDRKYQ